MMWTRNKMRLIVCYSMLTLFMFLGGCWDYHEINNYAIATGMAIDINEKNQYVVTVEVINPQTGGQNAKMEAVVRGIEGESIFEAVRKLIIRFGRKLYWGHGKVIIISEEVAKKGIKPILDWVYRDAEVRADMWLFVAKGRASDIFDSDYDIATAASFYLDSVQDSNIYQNSFYPMELWKFLQRLMAEGFAPVVPLTNTVDYNGKKLPQVYGIAVFHKDVMVGHLDGIESKAFNWISEKNLNGLIVVKKDSTSHSSITYEIDNNSGEITPKEINGQIIMQIDIKMDVTLSELVERPVDFSDEKVRVELEKEVSNYVKTQIEQMIKKVQHEYVTDIFGFGNSIKQKFPNEWKKMNSDWHQTFCKLPLEVNVEIKIVSSALVSTPIKMRD